MKFVTILTAGCLLAVLAACGGGESNTSEPTSAVPIAVTTFDATAFLGDWFRVDKARCFGGPVSGGFKYGDYYFKNDKLTLSADKAVMRESLYTDINCTLQAGTLTETYSASYTASSATGKIPTARMEVRYIDSATTVAPGGAPLKFTKVPDGSQTGGSGKDLIGVENSQLLGPDSASPKDADGYFTKLKTPALYTR